MTNKYLASIAIISFFLVSFIVQEDKWIKKAGKSYDMNYMATDKAFIDEYEQFIAKGTKEVVLFFGEEYKNKFQVWIHPNRQSLDSTWQQDWKMPGFKSERWMVASGVAKRIDIISPRTWDSTSCEHKYAEKQKLQQLITHELVHVFHGQLNTVGDFSDAENIDWFVEGLAAYASGQCDASVIANVKKAIADKSIPASLDKFWTGKLRYGLSGSVVMFIDKKYGRMELKKLLAYNKKSDILAGLQTTEGLLLDEWKAYIEGIKN